MPCVGCEKECKCTAEKCADNCKCNSPGKCGCNQPKEASSGSGCCHKKDGATDDKAPKGCCNKN